MLRKRPATTEMVKKGKNAEEIPVFEMQHCVEKVCKGKLGMEHGARRVVVEESDGLWKPKNRWRRKCKVDRW